jgi:flagellar basal-body rod modification protein FlgD
MSVAATQGTSTAGATGYQAQPATTTAPASAPVTENMFLQLLVAQLQNQDPTNPTDSTTFVTQLAQFQTMEQSLNQGEDITAIRTDMDQLVKSLGATTTNGTTTS